MLINPKSTINTGIFSALTTTPSEVYQLQESNENLYSTCNDMLHHVYSVGKESNKSYTSKEILQKSDRNQFVEEMTK